MANAVGAVVAGAVSGEAVTVSQEEQTAGWRFVIHVSSGIPSWPMLKMWMLRSLEDVVGHTEMSDRSMVNPA